jgi:predicted metal-dependent phosphoesterase TrpH
MVDKWRADLHAHSTCSDGSLEPMQLLEAAQRAGLQGLSITDHDTVRAYDLLPEGLWKSNPDSHGQGAMQVLTGMELTSQLAGQSVHLLAYGFDPSHPLIREACEDRRVNRITRFLEMRDNLRKLGVPLSEKIDLPEKVLGRPQLAAELIELGVCRDYPEAFAKYLGDSSPAYVPGKAYPTAEAIDLLHAAGAWVVLAHPMLLKRHVCEEVLKMPLDGLEAFYGRFHHKAMEWLAIASSKDWLVTGGSDFHGQARPDVVLGQAWTPQETFDLLKNVQRAS